jgi:Zn-dependent protease with chaperone function
MVGKNNPSMNIYLKQDGSDVTGPFTVDEVKHKIYSGALPRSASARQGDVAEWQPVETILNGQKPAPQLKEVSSSAISLESLRDPKEKTALIWLYVASVPAWLLLIAFCVATFGIPLIILGMLWVIKAIGELWFAAYLKTNAVRVSETQLPELYRVAKTSCERLDMERPDVYVLQHNVWNAFATKIFGRRMVVLLSGAVDSILLKGDEQQLAFLLGHELGHHWAGHFNFSQKLAKMGNIILWLALWHSRRAELTCDRVGLFCAGNLKSAQLAMLNATVGAQLANRVNAEQAIAQWLEHRSEFFVGYRTLYSTHPHLLARLDHMTQAAREFGMTR